jgi:hypothetical protein
MQALMNSLKKNGVQMSDLNDDLTKSPMEHLSNDDDPKASALKRNPILEIQNCLNSCSIDDEKTSKNKSHLNIIHCANSTQI